MRQLPLEANGYCLVAVLTGCIRQPNPRLGSQLHALALKTRHHSCVHVANALLGMYVSSGCFDDAHHLFDEMSRRDVSSWNVAILGSVKEGRYERAFQLFREMRMEGNSGDGFSVSTLLATAVGEERGGSVHGYAIKTGLELDLSVGNALLGFYTRSGGRVEDVVDVFQRMPVKDVITWTGMISGFMEFGLVESAVQVFDQMPERNYITYSALLSGFCQNGEGLRGLEFFRQMLEEGSGISESALTSVVRACAVIGDKKKSEQIHGFMTKIGYESNPWIEAALVDMCAKCGRMRDAEKIFSRQIRDENFPILWTSLIVAHARNGQPDDALSLFHSGLKMVDLAVAVDEITLATVLGVCGTLGFAEMGVQMHCYALKSGFLADVAVGNGVTSMYAKCGNLEDAIDSFDQMPLRDLVSWNALVNAELLHQRGDEVLNVWGRMERLGVKPDSITLLLVISACRYTSSDSTGTCRRLLHSMTSSYGIEPASEHYAATVDVLGYWGRFDEAVELIETMPVRPDVLVWRALLDNCRLRSNISLGRQVVQRLLALEPRDPSSYILVSNLYSASGRWHCSERTREEMRGKGLKKNPARSWIVHRNSVHSFYGRDRSHPQAKDIYAGLDVLILECMKAGYEPDTSFVLHEVEEYQKRDFLFYHSSKLAVMYGILAGEPGRPVRVVKNVRLCGDCHEFLKVASSVTRREILVRDALGFHRFAGGECSCRDYNPVEKYGRSSV